MGASGDWAFVGGGAFSDAVDFEDSNDGSTASLTGAAATAFDAAVGGSTPYSVTITAVQSLGDVEIAMKGGTFVPMEAAGSNEFTKTITSGAGSGFVIRAIADVGEEVCTLSISNVVIEA